MNQRFSNLRSAKAHLKTQLPRLVRDWQETPGRLFRRDGNQLVFCDELRLEIQPDGQIKIFARNLDGQFEASQLPLVLRRLDTDLRLMAERAIQRLAQEELIRLTGREALRQQGATALSGILQPVRRLATEPLYRYDRLMLKEWVAQVTGLLPAEALRVATLLRGSEVSVAACNRAVAHLPIWHLLEKDAPNLLPLVFDAVESGHIALTGDAFRDVKQLLRGSGLSRGGWKALAAWPLEQMHYLLKYVPDLVLAQEVVRHFHEVGEAPPMPMLRFMVGPYSWRYRKGEPQGTLASPAWFDAAAIGEMKSRALLPAHKRTRQALRMFLHYEYGQALDWAQDWSRNGRKPDAHQLAQGWGWITRQSEAWHEEQIRRAKELRDERYKKPWEMAVPAYRDGPHDVVPLDSARALMEEGQAMHHCVGSDFYIESCFNGHSRIYSIRLDGQGLATVQLVRGHVGWRIAQNYGPCNQQPDEAVKAVALRLSWKYTQAAK